MGVFETLLDNTMEDVKKHIKRSIDELVASMTEPWIGKAELSKHLGRGENWISERLQYIPHIKEANGTVKFKKSHVDKWLIESHGKNYEEVHNKAPVVRMGKRNTSSCKFID